MIERKALIFNIQKYNTHDGHGVRTLVFFKGCPLRCKWCSNPEGQVRQYQVLFKKNLCVHCGACVPVCPVGIHKMPPHSRQHEIARNIECIGCRKCEEACTVSALAVSGEKKTISELVEIIEEDKPFYDMSGGGVTLGGGDPLMQPEAAANLLMVCRQRGINTAVETCGYARPETLMKIAEYTDLFLYDVKHMNSERHYELTGVRNESILSNLKMLFEYRHNVRIRIPLLKDVNDTMDDCRKLIQFLMPFKDFKNFKGIDILPYHKLGTNKYSQLGWDYRMGGDPVLNSTDLDRITACFDEHDLRVSVLRH
ncbi:MAG: choline TMA-lyase-activating enzyme [Desulfovibrio sp.]|nr:choline TMA-lyase-activating enzyme [Desulfovibrio sp.]MBI4960629.1 choline TMA-lyase-activating enzyme [Desulfovibrio sp.]